MAMLNNQRVQGEIPIVKNATNGESRRKFPNRPPTMATLDEEQKISSVHIICAYIQILIYIYNI